MQRSVWAGLTAACILGGAVPAQPVRAQAPPEFQVGVPGCADDVAVRASREAITFVSRGRPVRAWLYTPGVAPNGGGVVMLHGGTGFEMNAILFDAHAIQLASRGYWVILPAYFDASAPDQRRRLVNGRAWRQVALDAAAQLTERAGTDPGRVALWGYSRGAGVAVNAATMPDGGVRSAILVAGAGSIGENPTAGDLSVLLLHARRDEAVPVRATLELAGALREAGAAVQVQGLEFDGHQYDLPTWCAVMSRTRGFLESHLESVDASS